MFLLALACSGTIPIDKPDEDTIEHIPGDTAAPDTTDTGETSDTGDTGETEETAETAETAEDTYEPQPYDTSPFDCETEIAPLPADDYPSLEILGGEDFTFLSDGRIATIDSSGALVLYDADGNKEMVRPALSQGGIAQLPDGDIVLADRSVGRVARISLADGALSQIVNLQGTPNGVRVGPDGMIYVDDSSGSAWRVDPDTAEMVLITDDLYAPNGIVVDNDGVVYIGDDYGWIEVVRPKTADTYYTASLYSDLPSTDSLEHDCEWRVEGDACTNPSAYSFATGTCRDDGAGVLGCDGGADAVACEGLAEGDGCVTEYFGRTFLQTCHMDTEGALFCPRADPDAEAACGSVGDDCAYGEVSGRCARTQDKVVVCAASDESATASAVACEGLADGDHCDIVTSSSAKPGLCQPTTDGALTCRAQTLPAADPVDAIDLDECGQLYATSFYAYGAWRWTGPRKTAEDLWDRPTPYSTTAMRFGRNGAGFDNRTLYIWARSDGLIAVDVGVPGLQSR